MSNDYYDIRKIQKTRSRNTCPIEGCNASLQTAPSQWGDMPFCPLHFIRIHKETFVYYNGSSREEKKTAALRNIRFNKKIFAESFLDKTNKAESHRICHETSEDALTWNVFTEILVNGYLDEVAKLITQRKNIKGSKLILWGQSIDCKNPPSVFEPLEKARSLFEGDLTTRFLTEPDVIIYVHGEVVIGIEAKFTSTNPIATNDITKDEEGDKPKSREGLIKRYNPHYLKNKEFHPETYKGQFLSQIYRNLIFASHMAISTNTEWYFCNLISEKQMLKKDKLSFQNIEAFYKGIIADEKAKHASLLTWEKIYESVIQSETKMEKLASYMIEKTANLERAFNLKTV
jgi:hypothetical protein